MYAIFNKSHRVPSYTSTPLQYRMWKYKIQKIALNGLYILFPRLDTFGDSFLEFLTSVLAYAIIILLVLVRLE